MSDRSWHDLTPLPATVGDWVVDRIDPTMFTFVAGCVPSGFASYAAVHHVFDDPPEDGTDVELDDVLASLRRVLSAHTSSHRCVCGVWEGTGYFGGGHHMWVVDGVQHSAPNQSSFSDEATAAPRLQLPSRGHVLFDAVLDDLAPLVVDAAFGSWLEPSVFWPVDRAWFAATDVDLWVTLVGGSHDLVKSLLDEPALRVEQISLTDPIRPDWSPYR